MTRRLVVMRHAKAEAAGPSDFERPLAARGHRDAADAGTWLAGQDIVPDLALVSAALRTRETWEAVAAAAAWDLEADYDRGLYSAEPDTVRDLISASDDAVGTLVLIGHNPTMALLAQSLGDGAGDPALEDRLFSEFPTSATAVFDHAGSWADLGEGTARLVGYHVGRG